MKLSELKYADGFDNMTLRCCMVLIGLRGGRLDFGVLTDRLGLPKPALSRALDTLGIAGLVRRERRDDDGRMVSVWLTDEGRKVAGVIYG